ncbi:MAG: hypothetical protein GDA43_18770 [Hormoscilla sp. SP5CHS1]|nr:hypothetical protein [Hormoscilla sp. SP12CHS1]MBC6454991.1 hypothetical protein [Hormoscilla sp. SP5CHS1]
MVVSPELLDSVIGLVKQYLKTFDKYPLSQLPFTANPNKDVEDIINGIKTQIDRVAID